MELELKNGEVINIEVGPLFLEYMDDYQGGINQLIDDWKNKENLMYIVNFFAYAAIASNYDKPIEKRDTLKLITIKDLEKIAVFVSDKLPDVENHVSSISSSKHF